MNQKEENAVIRQVQNGEQQAYTLLVEKYKGPLFNLAYRMTGNYQDAEDLAQEAFVKAYLSLRRFNRKKRFFPWLYTICLNLIRNHLKKERKNSAIEDASVEDSPTPEQAVLRQEEAEKLAHCVRKLPLDLREAVILRYYQELSFADISETLGISLSAAKMRVYRGLERLRELRIEN
jgi:RNA polymerase sigma-70 factor (ECF subfamily)